jgi:transposase
MDVLYARCCGIDVHKQTAVACVVVQEASGRPTKEIRTFGTMTDELLALADWLEGCGVTRVAMESTGVYWKPLWNLMEDRFTLLLVNAQHVKAVPGRKTDVRDCEWLADLLRHGLLKPSYVPDRSQRELRGEEDPSALAELARGRLRPQRAALERAVELLDGIPGIGRRIADPHRRDRLRHEPFPTAAHLASWAGVCPGNNQSAGKRLGGKVRSGNRWLRTALVEAAQAAGRTRGTYLGAQFRRLTRRRGKQPWQSAIRSWSSVAFAHSLDRVCRSRRNVFR